MSRISTWRTVTVIGVALVFGAVAVAGYFQGTRLWGDVRAIELTTLSDPQQPSAPQPPIDDDPARRVEEDADDGSGGNFSDDGPEPDSDDADATADDGSAGGNNTRQVASNSGDGDATAGDDGTGQGNNTGDGDATAGNDGTGGGSSQDLSRDRSSDVSSASRGGSID